MNNLENDTVLVKIIKTPSKASDETKAKQVARERINMKLLGKGRQLENTRLLSESETDTHRIYKFSFKWQELR